MHQGGGEGDDVRVASEGVAEDGPASARCRVLVADRSLVFAEGVVALLAAAGMTARATALEGVQDALDDELVSVVVIDGQAAEQLAFDDLAGVEVLLLLDDDGLGGKKSPAANSGVAWLSRHTDSRVLIEAVLALNERRRVGRSRLRQPTELPLTDRELAVLGLLSRAMTKEAIADSLGISPHTVRTHIRNLMVKLDAHTRAEALTTAARWGVLSGSITDRGQ